MVCCVLEFTRRLVFSREMQRRVGSFGDVSTVELMYFEKNFTHAYTCYPNRKMNVLKGH